MTSYMKYGFKAEIITNEIFQVLLLFLSFVLQQDSPSISASLDAKVAHLLIVIFIAVIFHMIDRQAEYISRIDYKSVNDRLKDFR